MVEKYFDKAGHHTNIRSDLLNFYKKADNVVKFNLTLIRGTHTITQMMIRYKLSPPTDVSIKLISFLLREGPDMRKTWIWLKLKPLLVS
jgi:hypothetical protein